MTVEKKPLPTALIDALLADYKKPEDLIGQDGLLKQLTRALVERVLQAEMTEHLGHGKNQLVATETGNTRNGRNQKTLKDDFGTLPIDVPRDRAGIHTMKTRTRRGGMARDSFDGYCENNFTRI